MAANHPHEPFVASIVTDTGLTLQYPSAQMFATNAPMPNVHGVARPVTLIIHIPPIDERWHHGAYLARWREGKGEITTEEANRLVAEARIRRGATRAAERARRSENNGKH